MLGVATMELKSTLLGKHLAQHPYNRVKLLTAGVEVSGERHEYLIPFNQLLAIHCKRGLVWGELEFVLLNNQVVRLHGTEWNATQHFYHHLTLSWNQWSQEMAAVAAEVLNQQYQRLQQLDKSDGWLQFQAIEGVQAGIREALISLPLPASRLPEFPECQPGWQACQSWLNHADLCREQHNQRWTEKMLAEHADFFSSIESSPLNISQAQAVVNGEKNLLVLAGAGSGKTSVLVARAGWLIARKLADPQQILLLAFGRKAAQEMEERITERLHTDDIQAQTFHALALHIIGQGGRKQPQISELESDTVARHKLLIECWQSQCQEKKAQAKGWRDWLAEELGWTLNDGSWWQDEKLARRLAPRLDRWLGLIRGHGGSQAEMIAQCPEDIRAVFQKRVRLMSPLLKAWKTELKAQDAVDFAGLIHQAINVLDKGRFVSPWKHILVDEFQDISPQRAALLEALRRQNSQTHLFAVGDDWQAIYRFSGASINLTTDFETHFGRGESRALDTTYRFNSRIGEIANAFIQQNPEQKAKPLNSLTRGDSKAVTLIPETQLEALLDKMSGYVKPEQRILILARYHHLKPMLLARAETRWPKLHIDFMTVHASKGQQADYVLVLGLHSGADGFPAPARESILEQALLPEPDGFPDAEERRLLYVAITRARHRAWLLFDPERPSAFVEPLRKLGVPVTKKP
ncbi:DNA helicase [Salmonella enterica subsp. enterica serovar Choleraesuis]|nr:DNA helicase [Salmonella enterica subsp. enterica serovar Choleraesuis]